MEPESTHPSLNWFCLRSEPKREHTAAVNLSVRVGIETFAPRIRLPHLCGNGVKIMATEALFPGYLFARFVYPAQMRHVVSTSGVVGIVTFGGQPPPVADEIIEDLRREVSNAQRSPIAPVLEVGAWVRILSGSFHDHEGRVAHFDPSSERVRLLLSLLGREVQVSVPVRQVAIPRSAYAHYPAGLMAGRASPLAGAARGA